MNREKGANIEGGWHERPEPLPYLSDVYLLFNRMSRSRGYHVLPDGTMLEARLSQTEIRSGILNAGIEDVDTIEEWSWIITELDETLVEMRHESTFSRVKGRDKGPPPAEEREHL